MSRCPSRAESPPGGDTTISTRLTSHWAYFAKRRILLLARFNEGESISTRCGTSSRNNYLLKAILASETLSFRPRLESAK
ncbi:MAG: hypothetical protein ABIS27_08855 [Longimicrobiales bacterium]